MLPDSYSITFSNLVGGRDPPSRDLELTEERDFLFLEELLEAEDSKSERHERLERLPPWKILLVDELFDIKSHTFFIGFRNTFLFLLA